MKKANPPVRAEEWENEKKGSGIERERERRKFSCNLLVYEAGKLKVTA